MKTGQGRVDWRHAKSGRALTASLAGLVMLTMVATLALLPEAGYSAPDGPDKGACCAADGPCQITEEQACLDAESTFLGVGTICDECRGACCVTGNFCDTVEQHLCDAVGGEFQGPGSTCDVCQGPGACCLQNYCTFREAEVCADLGGNFLGPGVPCGTCTFYGRCCTALGGCFWLPPDACGEAFDGNAPCSLCGFTAPENFSVWNGPLDGAWSSAANWSADDGNCTPSGSVPGAETAVSFEPVCSDSTAKPAFSAHTNVKWLSVEDMSLLQLPLAGWTLSSRQFNSRDSQTRITGGVMKTSETDIHQSGEVMVSGSSGLYTSAGQVQVGRFFSNTTLSEAKLRILAGAKVNVGPGKDNFSGLLFAGYNGPGTVEVLPASSLVVGNQLLLGYELGGSGVLHVTGGSADLGADNLFTNLSLVLGLANGSEGLLRATDDASVVGHSYLAVGVGGNGELQIENGAELLAYGAMLGLAPDSSGQLVVDGVDSVVDFERDLYIGGVPAGPGGSGIVRVLNGGSLDVGTWLVNWDEGLLHLGANTQATAGHFEGWPGSVLRVDISPTSHGRLSDVGVAILGGTLDVRLVAGANPQLNDTYTILDSVLLYDQFNAVILPYLGPNRQMMIEQTNEGGLAGGEGGLAGGGEGGIAGGGGSGGGEQVNIIIVPPGSSPNFDDPNVFALEGIPTGLAVPRLDGARQVQDIAISVADADVQNPGTALLAINDGTGDLFVSVLVPVGRDPSGIASAGGGFANTGNDDLVVSNREDDTVTVIFNEGDRTFTTVEVPVGDAPVDVATGELLGNGFNDIVTANELEDSITILANDGARGFTVHDTLTLPPGSAPAALTVEDVDNTKDNDIIVITGLSRQVIVFQNLGDGTFTQNQSITVGENPVALSVEDVDNTKDNDVIVVGTGPIGANAGYVAILLNDGDGTFAPPLTLPIDGEPRSVDAWDADGDGDVDIAVVVNDQSLGDVVRVLRNDSTGAVLAYTLLPALEQQSNPQFVRGADLTPAVADDLVTADVVDVGLGGVAGGGGGTYTVFPNHLLDAPCAGDFNNDQNVGVPDLLALLSCWGTLSPGCEDADITNDGSIGVPDLLELLAAWGACE